MAPAAVIVKLRIDGSLVDVSSYVRGSPGGGPQVRIIAGAPHDQVRAPSARCTFFLDNRKTSASTDVGRWTNDNPNSPYYMLLDNVEVQVSRDSVVLFTGYVDSWGPQTWDSTGRDVVMPTSCYGVLGRPIQAAKRALGSPVYRDVMGAQNNQYRVAYWPMEEGANATQFANVVNPAYPSVIEDSSVISLSSFSSPGSANLPTLETGARIVLPVPTYAPLADEHKFVQLWNIPAAGLTDSTVLARYYFADTTTVAWYDLIYRTASNGALRISAYNASGGLIQTFGDLTFLSQYGGLNGLHFLTSTEWDPDGAGNTLTRVLAQPIDADDPQSSTAYSTSFTGVNVATARISSIVIFPNVDGNGVSVGHAVLVNDISGAGALGDAIVGHATETAGNRFERLCTEEGLDFETIGDPDLTAEMGVQAGDASFIELLYACVDADQAILREARDSLTAQFICGYRLYNRVPTLTMSYTDGDKALGSLPVRATRDKTLLHNDVTTIRSGGVLGSSARVALETGPLSIEDPPDGAGVFDRGPIALNVERDDQLEAVAGWILHMRTSTDIRFEELGVELARTYWQNDADQLAAAIAVDISDLIYVTDWPVYVAQEGQLMILRGYELALDQKTWSVKWRTTQGWPYEVEVTETGGSTLVAAVDDNDTSWLLTTSAGPEWDVEYEPYFIQAFGEAVRVTAMATSTPSFLGAASGDHDDNASLTPGLPLVALQAGDLLLLVAAIRATGASVTTPAGWTPLSTTYTNFRLYGRYWTTGLAGPTVSFTGGAAGDTTSAQIAAFRGVTMELDDGDYGSSIISPQTQANSSAQDIAYPALSIRRNGGVALVVGWKQDDWTSVATPAAMDAEIGEESSTSGSDQGIAWYYDIQSTAADLAAGSLVVTGGASAISRAIVLALRPMQTATVERSVNGISTAIAAGEAVTTWRFGVQAL